MNNFPLHQALRERRTCRAYDDRAVPSATLDRLVWAAQGIITEDGKRTAPSAHALHPLCLTVSSGRIEGQDQGIYSVDPQTGSLEMMRTGDVREALQAAALEDQPWIGSAAGILTICANFADPAMAFALQPPYGARGARYVYVEAGAAAQNVHLQAVSEGLGCVLVAGFRDEATADVLGLQAPVAPVLHLCFGWPAEN